VVRNEILSEPSKAANLPWVTMALEPRAPLRSGLQAPPALYNLDAAEMAELVQSVGRTIAPTSDPMGPTLEVIRFHQQSLLALLVDGLERRDAQEWADYWTATGRWQEFDDGLRALVRAIRKLPTAHPMRIMERDAEQRAVEALHRFGAAQLEPSHRRLAAALETARGFRPLEGDARERDAAAAAKFNYAGAIWSIAFNSLLLLADQRYQTTSNVLDEIIHTFDFHAQLAANAVLLGQQLRQPAGETVHLEVAVAIEPFPDGEGFEARCDVFDTISGGTSRAEMVGIAISMVSAFLHAEAARGALRETLRDTLGIETACEPKRLAVEIAIADVASEHVTVILTIDLGMPG
jgi:hypothetical protein